jgi:hypothetical protein
MNRIDAVYIEKRIQLICSTPHLKEHDDVTQTWRDKGQYAILHHLNGVYAYQPLLIRY